jgi:hypothetical protein
MPLINGMKMAWYVALLCAEATERGGADLG